MAHSNAIEITVSDLKAFKRCRRLWQYKSSMRQNLVPKARAVHFVFGDLFHQALEQFYTGDDLPDVWFESAANDLLAGLNPAETPNLPSLLEDILMGPPLLRLYKKFAARNDDFKVISTEQRLTVKLNNVTPGNFFSFKYDALVHRNGQLWLHDFKTTRQMTADNNWLVYDDQAVAYQWAYQQATGQPIAGVIYTFIKKKLPTVPELLKNGQLSKRKDLLTTYEAYLTEIKKHGLNIRDYSDHLDEIEKNELGHFFARTEARATDVQKQIMGAQLAEIANMMADPDLYLYPSPDKMNCSMCDYKEPCLLLSAGLNDSACLQANFKLGEPRE